MPTARRGVPRRTTMRRYFSAIAVPYSVISYGENHYDANGNKNRTSSDKLTELGNKICTTTHAEENAIRKLPPLPRHKKLKKIDLLVIRANKVTLGSSKPCIHCLLKLQTLPSKGYSVENIFFSTSNGQIEVWRLNDLLNDTDQHVSSFYKGTGFKCSIQ